MMQDPADELFVILSNSQFQQPGMDL